MDSTRHERCGLVMLAGPADAGIARMMLRHVRRAANFDFSEIVLTIDTLPSRRYPDGSMETKLLRVVAEEMLLAGDVTQVVTTSALQPRVELQHFGRRIWRDRDFRGIPLLGWALGIDSIKSEFICHFDSDILMYSAPNFSWVECAIQRIQNDNRVMFVAPRGGPPGPKATGERFEKTFSSRRFVVSRSRLEGLLPLGEFHSSWKRHLVMLLGGPSSYWPWESHIQRAINNSSYSNVWLGDTRAWFLHSPDHSELWRANLPSIVNSCESGRFPPLQAGDHELNLSAWIDWLQIVQPQPVLPRDIA